MVRLIKLKPTAPMRIDGMKPMPKSCALMIVTIPSAAGTTSRIAIVRLNSLGFLPSLGGGAGASLY